MPASESPYDAMLQRVAKLLRNVQPLQKELELSPGANMAEWRGLHMLRDVLMAGPGWEATGETLFHRSEAMGDVFIDVGVSMVGRFLMQDAHIYMRVVTDEGTMMRPCVAPARFSEGVPLSDHIAFLVLLARSGWPLEPLPETMLPCASTLALREALLDPSSSDEFVRRIGLALTYNGGHQQDRIKTEVVLARKELTIRLLEDGRLPLAALPSVLWYPEALPRWRTALHEAGGGDEDAVSALLKSWADRETEVWECLSLLQALNQVLDDQSASGRSWLIQAHRHDITSLIEAAGPDACMSVPA